MRMFPVLRPQSRTGHQWTIQAIPWELIAPHDAQAKANHGGQSLEDLAKRGGLCPVEANAVLDDSRYPWGKAINKAAEERRLIERVEAWKATAQAVALARG